MHLQTYYSLLQFLKQKRESAVSYISGFEEVSSHYSQTGKNEENQKFTIINTIS